jgi:hypothetical protein
MATAIAPEYSLEKQYEHGAARKDKFPLDPLVIWRFAQAYGRG